MTIVLLLLNVPVMGCHWWAFCQQICAAADRPLTRIAFGSCAKQDDPQPIWDAIVDSDPERFLFIGDNIYGDSEDMNVLQAKWNQLAAQPGYQRLKSHCPILATWDDHDYGANDAGHEYPMKRESQKLFLDFFEEPADSPRRRREGIYDAKQIGPEGQRVQFILLDTRYFRSELVAGSRNAEPGEGVHGPYVPNLNHDATVLGETQWKWLEQQLRMPAEIRIIASSIQVIPDSHGWEKWGNFPLERERLFRMLAQTKANGVIFISGDRHAAEISKLQSDVGYPVYDVTSSSLNRPGKWRNELNPHRVGLIYPETNFGMIRIDWNEQDPVIRLQICDGQGKVVLQERLPLSRLQPGAF